MVQDKLIPLCKLYENVSKTSGKRYFVGNLSFTSKLLVFSNEDAKEGEPGWTLFLAEREPKQDAGHDRPAAHRPKPHPEAGDHGGIDGGDWPRR